MIEILIVFVLLAAVFSIAVRSVSDTVRRDRVNKVVAIVSADLEQAYQLAARQRAPVRIIFDSATRKFIVAQRSDTSVQYRTRQFTSTGDMQLDFFSPTPDKVDILPSGLSTSNLSVTFGIYSKGTTTYTKTLTMSRAGMVRVQ